MKLSLKLSFKWVDLALCALLLLMGFVFAKHMGAYAGGSDSSGYMNFARLMRSGATTEAQRAVEGLPPSSLPGYSYVPLGFIPLGDRLAPTYPMGLPLMLAAASVPFGSEVGPAVVMWLHGMAALVLLWLLAREVGLTGWWAVAAPALLAAGGLFQSYSVQLMSDMPAMVWTTAAVLAALRSRRHAGWSLLAGLAVAMAVLVRPTNLLIMLPVGLALGLGWRRWLGLVLGGLPGAVFLAFVNHSLYGKAYVSGYGNVWELFHAQLFWPTLGNYVNWLPNILSPLVMLAPLAPWLCRRDSPSRVLWVLGSWAFAILGLYAFYQFTSETWWYLRFLLPAFPALLLLSLLAARHLAGAFPGRLAGPVAALLILGCGLWAQHWGRSLAVLESGKGERVYLDACRLLEKTAPSNAVVLSCQTSGALACYTGHIIVRLDCMKDDSWRRLVEACRKSGRPVYAMLYPEELADTCNGRIPGHWVKKGEVRQISLLALE